MRATIPRPGGAEISVLLVLGVSWAALIVWLLAAGGGSIHSQNGAMGGMRMALGTATGPAGVALIGLPMWVLMCVAMMGPVSVATFRQLWVSGDDRRGLIVGGAALVHLAMWTIFGAVAITAAGWLSTDRRLVLGLVLLAAAAWELTVPKRHALAAAHVEVPRGGLRAPNRAVAQRTVRTAGACLSSCWALMLVMAVAPMGQMVIWMPLLAALVFAQQLSRRPRLLVAVAAVVLAAAAAVVLALGT